MNPEVKNNQPGKNAETGWEELENLEQQGFSADEKKEDFQIPDETSREDRLSNAREAVEAAYQTTPVIEQPAPIIENKETEVDAGIHVKKRSKLDIIGRKRDEKRMQKITDIIEDATPQDIDARVEEASQLLDEHTAGLLLGFIEEGIPGQVGDEVWSKLVDQINGDDVKDAIKDSTVSPLFFVQRHGAKLSEKTLGVFVDAAVDGLKDWSEETSGFIPMIFDKDYSELEDLRKLPSKEKAKLIDLMLEKNRPGNALQLLDEELVEGHRDRFAESIKENGISPVQAVSGYFNGMTAEELGMPESFKTTMDNIASIGVPEKAIEYTTSAIPSAEIFDTLGPELSTHIIQTEIADLSQIISDSNSINLTFESKEEAESLKKVYDSLSDGKKSELNLAQIDFLRSHGKLVDELLSSQGEITEKQLDTITKVRNLQAIVDFDVNSIDDLDNFDEFLDKKVDEILESAEQITDPEGRERAFDAAKELVSIVLYGTSRNNLKILARRTHLITDNRNRYDQVFKDVYSEEMKDDDEGFKLFKKDKELSFSLDKFDELVRDGKLSPEDEGEVLAMLAYLNAGNDPKKLKRVMELARENPDGAGSLYKSLENLDRLLLLESNQNFKQEMTSPEQLIADGAEISIVEFQDGDETKQVQVINLGGRPFKILTHCLGAFGGYDLSQPGYWDTGTGCDYISSSLIADNCIRTAGDRKKGVYYGFSNLGEESIIGMSSGDLATYGVDHVEDTTPDDNNDDTRTGVAAMRQSFWYNTPDELIAETRARRRKIDDDSSYHSYNEVVLSRYNGGPKGDKNDRLHPSCILCFGKDEGSISEDMKRHASYFGVPICLIDEGRYRDK